MLVEYARNVLGIAHAEHAETSPDADTLVVTPLSCSLVGQRHRVEIVGGTRCGELYGKAKPIERYYCNYGLNPRYRQALEESGLRVSAVDEAGDARAVELEGHSFFLATLFLPQMSSHTGRPHPLLVGFAAALAGAAR